MSKFTDDTYFQRDFQWTDFDQSTDTLASSKHQKIMIQHVPTGKIAVFKAFITAYSDQFTSNWSDDNYYGRMDPVSTFERTSRKISLNWDVPAADVREALRNLVVASQLLKFLYPTYKKGQSGSRILNASPLLRIKFMNLIQNSIGTIDDRNSITNGLLVRPDGFTFTPNLDAGMFDPMPQFQKAEDFIGTDEKGNPTYIRKDDNYFEVFPKVLSFQGNFTVFHEHELGETDGEEAEQFGRFPYFSSFERSEVDERNPKKIISDAQEATVREASLQQRKEEAEKRERAAQAAARAQRAQKANSMKQLKSQSTRTPVLPRYKTTNANIGNFSNLV